MSQHKDLIQADTNILYTVRNITVWRISVGAIAKVSVNVDSAETAGAAVLASRKGI